MRPTACPASDYDLTSVRVPVLNGVPLKMLAALLESPLRGLVTGVLSRKFGLPRFRKLQFEEAPTYQEQEAKRRAGRGRRTMEDK